MEKFILASVAAVLLPLCLKRILAGASNSVRYPKGPHPWPFVGNIWTIYKLHTDTDKTLVKLARDYGNVCMLWLGSWPVLVINAPSAAHELLQKRAAITSSRPEHHNFRQTVCRGRLVLMPAGPEFRMLRKVYHKMLSPQQSLSSRGYQEQESVVFIDNLLEDPSGFFEGAERFALSIIFSAVYGVRLATLKHPIIAELYYLWEHLLCYFQPGVLPIDYFPCLLNLPVWMQGWHSLAKNLVGRELKIHRAFLDRVKSLVMTSAPYCFGFTLLKWQEADSIEDEMVEQTLAMLIGAGADTTSTLLQNFFKIMALHPQAVAAAHKELDETIGRDRLPCWDDESHLPYVRALIKELHRWAPIGSLGIPHATTESYTYGDYCIPKGTIVFPNLISLNRDKGRYFNPDVFEPRRFLGDDLGASASALQSDFERRDHFHYGFGRRLCPAIFVAEASLFISISRILWAFNIEQLPNHTLSMDDKIYGLTTRPKPFKISITCRASTIAATIKREVQLNGTSLDDLEAVK